MMERLKVMDISISCILPVVDETYSLQKTVDILEATVSSYILEYVIVTSPKITTQDSFDQIKSITEHIGDKINHISQKKPFIGGALQDALEVTKGNYILLMASDLETDPYTVEKMIEVVKEKNPDIVATSRWIEGGGFSEYFWLKKVLNYFFQKIFAILYNVKLTDLTYAFRLYKKDILTQYEWEELRHPFLFETIVKPLRFTKNVIEIPAKWEARTEGESQNTFLRNFSYLKIGIKTRFTRKNKLLKE